MTRPRTRREFLAEVGGAALAASFGGAIARDLLLGTPSAWAEDVAPPLTFGALEPLVVEMQETPANLLLSLLVARLRAGTELRTLVAAGVLANARTFGGEDYVGYHAAMALAPAYRMSLELGKEQQPLPVLKVLYRNTSRIQEVGGRAKEVLRAVEPGKLPAGPSGGDALRDAIRAKDGVGAERTLAALAQRSPEAALDATVVAVADSAEVHRVVLPYRAWDSLDVVGAEHALTLLRQSVRYCVAHERRGGGSPKDAARTVVPAALDRHGVLARGSPPPPREADDAWIERTTRALLERTPADAADLAAAALAEGISPAAICEAASLAANELVLRDAGRPARDAKPDKPVGSVHGDSIGVHASDSANAWRNLARASSARNATACAVLAAFQVALDRVARGGDFGVWKARPTPDDLALVVSTEPAALLTDAEGAIRENDQTRACAVVHRYGALGHPPRALFDLLLRHAVKSDGALHAEKYYRTVTEEFASTRPSFRWQHVVALARVSASESGQTAAGIDEASRMLGI